MIKGRQLVGLRLLLIRSGKKSNRRGEWDFLNASMIKMLHFCFLTRQGNGSLRKEWKPWMVRSISARGTNGGGCWWRAFLPPIITCPGISPIIRISLKLMAFRFTSNNIPICVLSKDSVLIQNFMNGQILL